MGIVKVEKVPKCDFCTKDALYDAPTLHGQSWANMCKACAVINSTNMLLERGSMYEQRTPAKAKGGSVITGIEASSLEEQVMGDRNIECPSCQDQRLVEPDAEYTYDCEGCGAQVKVPTPLMC